MDQQTADERWLSDVTNEARAAGLRGQVYLTSAALTVIRSDPVTIRNCVGDLAFNLGMAEHALRQAHKARGGRRIVVDAQ